MKVLIACEQSGVVRRAFRALGHDAWSCDLEPPEDNDRHHYACDARLLLSEGWDLLIAHPPCTALANSGAQHLYLGRRKTNPLNPARIQQVVEGVALSRAMWDAPIRRICVENPIMHGTASGMLKVPYTQIIQPYEHGHEATKTTCLWLKNLPLLTPTHIVGKGPRHITKGGKSLPTWYNLPPSPDRGKIRSRTFEGIALAMAEQFGSPHADAL